MNSFDIAASAIDMPPEAEPVMPASEVTVIASCTSGLGIAAERVANGEEARQRGDDAAEAVFRRRVHRREQRAGHRRLAALGEILGMTARKPNTTP